MSKSQLDVLLGQSLVARGNWEVIRLCNRIHKAPPTTAPAVFTRAIDLLHLWWQQTPANAPRMMVGTPPMELNELVFFTYCRAHFRAKNGGGVVQPDSDFKEVPWGQKPLFAPRENVDPAQLFQILINTDPVRSAKLLRQWAHRKRWHERVVRSVYWPVVPTETLAHDPLVSLFRSKLEEALLAANHMDAFFTQGRMWVQGSLLPLGARDDYVRDKLLEGQTTPMAKLYDSFLSTEVKESVGKLNDLPPIKHWAELTKDMQELWLLAYFCYSFDQYTVGETRFAAMYVILWHQWDQPHSDLLLAVKERLHRPALPLLCALGGSSWGVLSRLSEWRLCENLTHALVVWLQQVVTYHQGLAENGLAVWTCGMRIPLPSRPMEE